MADVYFKSHDSLKNRIVAIKELIEQSGVLSEIQKGDIVAVKLHPGEMGNPYHVDPLTVRTVINCIRARGGDPFITDTCTYYVFARHNALDYHRTALAHGFVYGSVGAPFIVADGLTGGYGVRLEGKGILREVYMAGLLQECDFLFVLSHCKGHQMVGYGGAIKNVGMGCVTKRTKLEEHRVVGYRIDSGLCTGCGRCRDACPWHFPVIRDGKAENSDERCMHCTACRDICPSGAIMLEDVEKLQQAVAAAACTVLSQFGRKTAFLNTAVNISRLCDCFDAPGDLIVPPVGYFASRDAVAIDRAFLDRAGKDVFIRAHGIDPAVQLEEAERLGGGENRVNLITIG